MVARHVGAASGSYLRGNFTDEQVQKLNRGEGGGALEQYRIVYFATYGLLPTELNCWSQPALMVSRPDDEDSKSDGLLPASQIGKLRLNADLAVLSACNTGAEGTGSGERRPGTCSRMSMPLCGFQTEEMNSTRVDL